MKNFKVWFLFLVILFVSTEAAPKGGRGGGFRLNGGRGKSYRGGGGGVGAGGDGEQPSWAFICIGTVILLCCCLVEQIEHENKIPPVNSDSVQISESDSAQLPNAVNPIQTS